MYWNFIKKLFKEILPEKRVKIDVYHQLYKLTIIIANIIILKSKIIVDSLPNKILTEKHLECATKMSFIGELSEKCAKDGLQAIENYKNNKDFFYSKKNKANINISPSFIEKILRKHYTKISKYSSIFLASVIEYFIIQIIQSILTERKTINIYDIENVVKNDIELNHFFLKNNIIFYTKSNNIIPKKIFQKLFINRIQLYYPNICFEKNILQILQKIFELKFKCDIMDK